jgi:hypothetical protein
MEEENPMEEENAIVIIRSYNYAIAIVIIDDLDHQLYKFNLFTSL